MNNFTKTIEETRWFLKENSENVVGLLDISQNILQIVFIFGIVAIDFDSKKISISATGLETIEPSEFQYYKESVGFANKLIDFMYS